MTREGIVDYIKEQKFGYLATVARDNKPRVRPIGMHTVYGDNVYFFTFATTRKVDEMDNNPSVEVVWSDQPKQTQVRIAGAVAVEDDEEVVAQFKADNPIVAQMLPPQAQHLFRLYRLEPDTVYWAGGLVPYTEVPW